MLREACRTCGGTGRILYHGDGFEEACPDCDDSGEILIDAEDVGAIREPADAGTPALNKPPRSLAEARAELDREARINFETLLDAAKRAFAAGDLATSESKARAALAVIRRVLSRYDEPQPDTFTG